MIDEMMNWKEAEAEVEVRGRTIQALTRRSLENHGKSQPEQPPSRLIFAPIPYPVVTRQVCSVVWVEAFIDFNEGECICSSCEEVTKAVIHCSVCNKQTREICAEFGLAETKGCFTLYIILLSVIQYWANSIKKNSVVLVR
jgi:hypothetical protein